MNLKGYFSWRSALLFLILNLFRLSLFSQIEKAVSWEVTKTQTLQNDTFTIALKANIKPGFHVYSSVPPPKEANLPTEITISETKECVAIGKLMETGLLKKQYDDIFETDVSYFIKEVTFSHSFKKQGKNPSVKGVLNYQVCDEEGKCVMQTKEFSVKLED